jgi:hypothetical protein
VTLKLASLHKISKCIKLDLLIFFIIRAKNIKKENVRNGKTRSLVINFYAFYFFSKVALNAIVGACIFYFIFMVTNKKS